MAAEATERAADEFASPVQRHPRDLLRRFGGGSGHNEQPSAAREVDQLEEMELNLGLSLGGRFGLEPSREKKLFRSSSITSLSRSIPTEHDAGAPAVVPPLTRTTSLPTAAEEHRKRKEMQSLKRLELKRRRLERKSSKSWTKDRDFDADLDNGQSPAARVSAKLAGLLRGGQFTGSEMGVTKCSTGMGQLGGAPQLMDTGKCLGPMSSPGPGGSQGSSSNSSAISDLENRQAVRGFNALDLNGSEEDQNQSATWPLTEPAHRTHDTTTTSLANYGMMGEVVKCSSRVEPGPSRTSTAASAGRAKGPIRTRSEAERNVMEEMPCVSTMRGDGPNGMRRIEGFLYKYDRGEEVRIVCVCHGRFLTPAEFVKHAGGADVPHPLRHIVVNHTTPSGL